MTKELKELKQDEAVLGESYTDPISGFTGVAIGIAHYLWGCKQVLLSKSGTGEVVGEWFDEQRLIPTSSAGAGGPVRGPARH